MCVMVLSTTAIASAGGSAARPTAQTRACIEHAAAKHQVSAALMLAIAEQESSFNPSAAGSVNANGTRDHGLFQINDAWLRSLSRHGVTLQHLYDACVSADVAGWILSQNFAAMGVNWRAVGAYNARTESKRVSYAHQIARRMPRHRLASSPVAPHLNTPQVNFAAGAIGAWETPHAN